MTDTLNIALVGSKFMGRTHSNAYLNVAKFFDLPLDVVMHTLCARDPEATADFAKRWGWQHASTDWQQTCTDPAVDLVDLGTPNHLHAGPAIAALEAGKHVACEKPLAGTLAESKQMVEAARKAKANGVQTFVWYNYRRCPAVAFAHQLVQQGKLGKIYHIRARYLQDWAGPEVPLIWRFQSDKSGSGALGDLTAHSVDMVRFVTGQTVEKVNGASMPTFIKERALLDGEAKGGEIASRGTKTSGKMGPSTVDDATAFIAEMSGGAMGTFEASRLSMGDKNSNNLEIHGELGSIRFNFERMNELAWYDHTLPEALRGWSTINVSNGAAGHPYAANWWPTAHAIGYEHGFINQAADMVLALAGQTPTVALPDFEDAYQTQLILETVVQSAKEGCAVKVSEVAAAHA